MPFTDANDGKRRWVSTRDTIWLQDPLRRAAETLARDLETFLYDENDPKHNDKAFLMWAVARYDIAKTGSGRYADTMDYDPSEAMKEPFGENKTRVHTSGRLSEIDVRMPEHAREALGKDFSADDKPTEEPHYSRPDLPSGVHDGREHLDPTTHQPAGVPGAPTTLMPLVNDAGEPAGLHPTPVEPAPIDPQDEKDDGREFKPDHARAADDGFPHDIDQLAFEPTDKKDSDA